MTYRPNKIDRTEFACLAAEGLTTTQLAQHFNTRTDTVSKIRRELGMSPRRPRGPKVDRDELLSLHHQGWTTNKLAEHYGVLPDSISRIKTQLGIQQVHDTSPERLARIAHMIEDGWSYAEIERTEGMCRDSLRKHFPGRGWTQEQSTEYLRILRMETGTHFNQRPKTYNAAKYETRTHPYGATKHPGSRTLQAVPAPAAPRGLRTPRRVKVG